MKNTEQDQKLPVRRKLSLDVLEELNLLTSLASRNAEPAPTHKPSR